MRKLNEGQHRHRRASETDFGLTHRQTLIALSAGFALLLAGVLFQREDRHRKLEWKDANREKIELIYRMSMEDLKQNIQAEESKNDKERDGHLLRVLRIVFEAKQEIELVP